MLAGGVAAIVDGMLDAGVLSRRDGIVAGVDGVPLVEVGGVMARGIGGVREGFFFRQGRRLIGLLLARLVGVVPLGFGWGVWIDEWDENGVE